MVYSLIDSYVPKCVQKCVLFAGFNTVPLSTIFLVRTIVLRFSMKRQYPVLYRRRSRAISACDFVNTGSIYLVWSYVWSSNIPQFVGCCKGQYIVISVKLFSQQIIYQVVIFYASKLFMLIFLIFIRSLSFLITLSTIWRLSPLAMAMCWINLFYFL